MSGNKIEGFGTGFELLEFYTGCMKSYQIASIMHQHGVCVTSLTTNSLRGSLMLLSSFILPGYQFLGKTTSSELVLIIVHIKHNGNFSPKILSAGTTRRCCCDSCRASGPIKLY